MAVLLGLNILLCSVFWDNLKYVDYQKKFQDGKSERESSVTLKDSLARLIVQASRHFKLYSLKSTSHTTVVSLLYVEPVLQQEWLSPSEHLPLLFFHSLSLKRCGNENLVFTKKKGDDANGLCECVVNIPGNPRVKISDPYPYPPVPLPVTHG